jgi:PAS domain S-box-containing protein
VNKYGAEYLGYSKEELIGEPVWVVVHPDDIEDVENQISKILKKKTQYRELEFRKVRKDGSVLYVHERLQLSQDEKGNPEELRIICRDITERKKYENELIDRESQIRRFLEYSPIPQIQEDFSYAKKYVEQLKDSGIKNLRKYFLDHKNAIYECRRKAKIISVNRAFLELFRAKDLKDLERNIERIITEQSVRMFIEGLFSLLEGKTFFSAETSYFDLDNRKIEAITQWVIVPGYEKTLDQVLVTLVDMTQQKETERELIHAKQRAEESDRLKTAFLTNLSHEIRTPMNAIVGFSELLRDNSLPDKEKTDFLYYLKSSCDALSTLVDDLVDIAKIEAGQTKILNSECFIRSLLDELYTYFREEIKSIKSPVELNLETTINNQFVTITDFFKLRQILSNLISNAIKFTKQGYIRFGCNLTDSDTLTFFVEDTGIGISKDQQHLIFDQFRQLDDSISRQYSGTGLGLTISKNLVELLGGKIWLESERGQGAVFYFTLPVILPDVKKIKETVILTEADMNKENWDLNRKVILIAEDDKFSFEVLKAILAKTKARLLYARNGKEAVELFKTEPVIDLILMDIQMPEMNGYEATRIIKGINKNVPVISQTAYKMEHNREESLKAGCDDFITKPILPDDLIRIIKKHIR